MKTSQKINFLDRSSYRWNYCSLGGSVRVKISSGDDIRHLGELDKKLWTVLSCPAKSLHYNQRTLDYLDADGDGKIKVDEVVAAAKWLSVVLKDMDLLMDGSDDLPVSNIDTSTDDGIAIVNTIKKLKQSLDAAESKISIKEVEEFKKIFVAAPFNGDGVITEHSCENELDGKALRACIDTVGGVADRGGETGVGAEQVEAFYAALNDWIQWRESAQDSFDALSAVEPLTDKINDYFMRCRLIAFNENASGAVDVSVDSLTNAANAGLLGTATAEIKSAPLARPQRNAELTYEGINPAWQETFSKARKAFFDKKFPSSDKLTLEQWQSVEAELALYKAWKDSEKGGQVASLGYDAAKQILQENRKDSLLELIARDKALEHDFQTLDNLDKLVHYNQYFYGFLNNYVILSDFYSPDKKTHAIFEEGKLYIDQRCCALCVRVEDMNAHADMSALSGMYLIYCTCSRKGETPFNIVAVLTVGDVKNLRAGTNAVFYDRNGQDWDAVVTKVVDNPISLSQAFWAPYRKFANFVSEKLKKSASEKDAKVIEDLKAAADTVPSSGAEAQKAASVKPAFDIAKFAGIFAAIGMAVGYIGAFFTELVSGISAAGPLKTIAVIFGIMLIISAPSCFLAGIKLHRRNLGPVLNANGWAINADVIVNIVFGATLTTIAKYPKMRLDDPFAEKKAPWWKVALIILGIVAIIAIYMYFSGSFEAIAGMFHE